MNEWLTVHWIWNHGNFLMLNVRMRNLAHYSPLSAINFLATYGTYITLASIVLFRFHVELFGAFKMSEENSWQVP